ncbi:hypothetical protein [Nocardioides pacificus]
MDINDGGRHAGPGRGGMSAGAAGSLVISLLLVGVVLMVHPSNAARTVRSLAGFESERLGTAPDVPTGEGVYKFSLTQRGSDDPVSYDPCRPIRVVVNPEGAPPGGSALIATAIDHISAATGFRFELEGTTEDRNFEDREAVLSSSRSDPVLVGWATEEEVPQLAGNVVGVGGSTALGDTPGTMRYVTGMVALDRDAFARLLSQSGGQYAEAQAIVDHEFGHLVGLDHVSDARELMNRDNVGVTSFGPGDREGLARLGSVPCR